MVQLRVEQLPDARLAHSNKVYLHPSEAPKPGTYIAVNEHFYFTPEPNTQVNKGAIAMSQPQRSWLQLALTDKVVVAPFDPSASTKKCFAESMTLLVDFTKKNTQTTQSFDTEHLSKIFKDNFDGQVLALGQSVVVDFSGHRLLVRVDEITTVDQDSISKRALANLMEGSSSGDPAEWAILTPHCEAMFMRAPESNIKLVGSSKTTASPNAILRPNFKFEDMGIGGLDDEFSNIFRRAFASRIFPPSLVEKLGIPHVKGLLLYGPPGTGKTLIARQIGQMLNAHPPKIVNGPEVLNKFVGQSEENIRKLFAEAEAEYKAHGEDSKLHIIIFDELDAICRQRGSRASDTGVGDQVVNQLLSKLDGIEQLNNVLVIGMTNRKDLIDEALLRPGRLEVHLEISLPDEAGRHEILKIHTAKMRQSNLLHEDVDLLEIATLAKNFSGAEICGLIKSASSFAFNRHVKVGTMAAVSADVENLQIMREDFMNAFGEVHASYGISEDEFETCARNGIIQYDAEVQRIVNDGNTCVNQVRNSERSPLLCVLFYGPSGSGKTALAATIAQASDFPMVRLLSPETLVGYSEAAKVSEISRIFHDAYKSPLSIIVVDSIERLVDYVPIGPRFSNGVLQALLVLLKRPPPPGRRLLIFCTTSRRALLSDFDMSDCFTAEIFVPAITTLSALEAVIAQMGSLSPIVRAEVTKDIEEAGRPFSVGVKKLLAMIEMAAQEPDDAASKFAEVFADCYDSTMQ